MLKRMTMSIVIAALSRIQFVRFIYRDSDKVSFLPHSLEADGAANGVYLMPR